MGEKKGQRGNIPPERERKRMNHELNARTRCFENWKVRSGIVIHLDGHKQLVIGLEQTDWGSTWSNMVSFFSFGGFWHVLIFHQS